MIVSLTLLGLGFRVDSVCGGAVGVVWVRVALVRAGMVRARVRVRVLLMRVTVRLRGLGSVGSGLGSGSRLGSGLVLGMGVRVERLSVDGLWVGGKG